MGNWLSWLANANEEPVTKDQVVQQKLMDYIKRLKADLQICESSFRTLDEEFVKCQAQHGIGPKLRACFTERQTAKKQNLAVQAAIAAVSEQLHTLYQQNLNHETMLLMRESAMIMLKTGQKGMNPDKTLNIMDDFNSTVEEKTELAAHMFASVKDNSVHTPQSYDESWDLYVEQNGGKSDTNAATTEQLSVPASEMPPVPSSPTVVHSVRPANATPELTTPLIQRVSEIIL